METTDILKKKMIDASMNLAKESREAIDSIDWKQILLGMNSKFNSDQLEKLIIETELLLCGLTSTIDFPNELETRMSLPREEVAKLLEEMDKNIFQKMKQSLQNIENKLDDSAIPLPPYAKDKIVIEPKANPIITSSYSHNNETDLYREHGIEIISNEYPQTTKMDMYKEEKKPTEEKGIENSNIIANKLFNNTASQKIVTDYSLPIINTKIDTRIPTQNVVPKKPHDPYHEEI